MDALGSKVAPNAYFALPLRQRRGLEIRDDAPPWEYATLRACSAGCSLSASSCPAGAALDQVSGGARLPAAYRDSPGTRLLIFGGIALFVGLTLSALHQSVLALFAGRSLMPRFVRRVLTYRWISKLDFLEREWHQEEAQAAIPLGREPARARKLMKRDKALTQFYVPRELVQPTRFGNALLAGGQRVQHRWELDPIVVWPRIERGQAGRGAVGGAQVAGEWMSTRTARACRCGTGSMPRMRRARRACGRHRRQRAGRLRSPPW